MTNEQSPSRIIIKEGALKKNVNPPPVGNRPPPPRSQRAPTPQAASSPPTLSAARPKP